MLTNVIQQLQEHHASNILSIQEFRDEYTVHCKKSHILEICTFLRDNEECRFDYCSDICGADAYTPENRFEVIYNLYSLTHKHRVRLKVFVDEHDLHVPSVTSIWQGAEWPERETYDMYGIIFDGNKDLRRMYMPEDFEHYPLRKDFPLMGVSGSIPLPPK